MTDPRHRRRNDSGERNEWGMTRMRQPDFSDVHRHIFNPVRVVIFLTLATLFWLAFYRMLPGCKPARPPQTHKPAASDSGTKP